MNDLECNSGLKYKVGDEVVVVSNDFKNVKDMIGFVGKVLEANENSTKFHYSVGNGEEEYWFAESELELVVGVEKDDKQYNPLEVQEGGGHYKSKGIQPVEYGLANNLSFPQVNIVKYVTRHEDKNGVEDLSKSIHYHFFEALRCYGVEGSTELKKRVLKVLGVKDNQ